MATEAGANANAAVRKINFLDLPLTEEGGSLHKRTCPVCSEGSLEPGKYRETWLLMNTAACSHCAQSFEFTDIPDNKIGDVREITNPAPAGYEFE